MDVSLCMCVHRGLGYTYTKTQWVHLVAASERSLMCIWELMYSEHIWGHSLVVCIRAVIIFSSLLHN